ncbi:sensor histidine kinase [Siansivirga zeaxanthinifaciens]|uniref:histidine kinase n=1 Tax=Siansivirga zeaxanthinifaciens CC-SAMT-1 TaxID=1454006 RepID=A0A0C5WC88_9FLAO|nr:sensor histidine kinase [Siansivirga zeaxanthinifaciens]AJR04678.1 histidine kinase [Siansivirga zeaxanthinifaciens CC-SAMT-1]
MPKRLLKSSGFIKTIFYASAFIILVVGGLTYRSMRDLNKASDLVTHTYKINVELEQILSYLKDAETAQRGFIITNDPIYLEPYDSGRENINNSFAELKALTLGNEVQQKNLKELSVLIDKRIDAFDKSFRFSAVTNLENPNFKEYFLQGKKLMDEARLKVENMIRYENDILKERQKIYKENSQITPLFLYLLLLISLLLMFLAYNRIIENLKKQEKTNQQLTLFKESANQSEIVSKHGNWVWNLNSNTFSFSDNLYRLLGEAPQSFEPNLENFYKYVHPEDLAMLQLDLEKMKNENDQPFLLFRIINKNKDIKHLKAYAKIIINSEGEKQLIGTTTDITDEIESVKLLEQRNLELERNNKELSAFNYVASHDLQEPLRKIQTFLSRLEDKEANTLSESGLKYIERIKVASSRMRLLIDDLLQFSRTNKADKVFVKSDINNLIEDAKQDLAEIILEEKAVFNMASIPEINVIPFQIQQLFANLISNSLKYKSPERIPEISIKYKKVKSAKDSKLSNAPKGSYHKITYKDNGIGFNNAYSEKIFILFNRLHNKDEYTGTGIGLSICKKIVENHQGYIFAKGKPQVGATFFIYLPFNK